MARYLLTLAVFAALALASCASSRDMFAHNDGMDQNTNAAMVDALSGIGK